jgi:two-component system, cell cycle response regulator
MRPARTQSPRPVADIGTMVHTDWPPEASTLRLEKGEASLLQAVGDAPTAPCLILYSGPHSGERYALQGERLRIGRAPECEICLDGPSISRRHADLVLQGAEVVLHDLGSVNGTHLNEERVGAPTLMREGDRLRLGDMVLKFHAAGSVDALLHDRVWRMATIDALTEVHTRRFLNDALERGIKAARRSGRPLSLMCLDLDHFKSVNDHFGHGAGDQVLRAAARAVRAAVRGIDIVGRTGGEEFTVVLPDCSESQALRLAERVRAEVASAVFEFTPLAGGPRLRHRQTTCIGVAELQPGMADAPVLMKAADERLYAAKRAGRDRVMPS